MKNHHITVFIPCHNASKTIEETLNSILNQDYKNFDVYIQDNNSTDNTREIISRFNNKKINLHKNKTNLGYSGNLISGIKKCSSEIVVLMAVDDILAKNSLTLYNKAFNLSPDIGAVSRPYYWFDKDINTPIRTKSQISSKTDTIITIDDDFSKIKTLFSSFDQLSGLALRKKHMNLSFGVENWISHAYPFISLFTNHPIVYLKDFTIAVRIGMSATRRNIYQYSPMIQWINMLNQTITEKNLLAFRQKIIKEFVATNYIGLIQIKNYGDIKPLYLEIFYLLKFNPNNIISLKFWLYVLVVMFTPKFILRYLTDWYKEKINSKFIQKIKFSYDLTPHYTQSKTTS